MMSLRIRPLPVILVLGLLPCWCAAPAAGENSDTQPLESHFAGISYWMTEEAHDGSFPVPPFSKVPVDVNADLVLRFRTLSAEEVAAASPEWRSVNDLLEWCGTLTAERALHNAAEVDLQDPDAVTALQEKVQTMDVKVQELVLVLQEVLGGDNDKAMAIFSGRFSGGTYQPEESYKNLAIWLRQEIEQLRNDAQSIVDGADQYEVLVQAYHDPLRGQRKMLHVDGYDNVPAGRLQPIPRFSLHLTEAEQAQLSMSIDMNKRAAGFLREIGKSGRAIQQNIRETLARLDEAAADLLGRLQGTVESWLHGLESAIEELQNQADDTQLSPATRQSLNDLIDILKAFQSEADTLQSGITSLVSLTHDIRCGKFEDLQALLFREDGILSRIETTETSLGSLQPTLQKWGGRLEQLATKLNELASVITGQLRDEILPAELDSTVNALAADFPETIEFFKLVRPYLRQSRNLHEGATILDSTKDEFTWHSLQGPPIAMVELDRAGWLPGERVTVALRVRKGSGASASSEAQDDVHRVLYRVEAEHMGIHRRITSNLIFTRATKQEEEAKGWNLNIAALANWSFHYRNPSGLKSPLNWLGWGLGVHLASLDQGTDNVEFGVGVNLVLWRGLVSLGYGDNLSLSEKSEYYLVGVDLYDVLNLARGGRVTDYDTAGGNQ